jgi:ABC-2 type transport system ATP-binding protein
MLQISGVSKAYGDRPALRGVDLEVGAGEIVALLGPNGAGKSTLVSIVAGLRRADAGSVTVAGIDVAAEPRAARRHLGVAPQDLGIYPQLNVRDNLVVFGELAGLRGGALRARIDEVAGQLGLARLIDREAGRMSGGERRRLHTAIALLHHPDLLLLDEPTAGADVQTRADLLTLVKTLAAEGSAVLYCTHYLPEVEALDAEVAVLAEGRIVARGTRAAVVQAGGATEVVLTFNGPAPRLTLDAFAFVEGSEIRIPTGDSEATVAAVMAALGSAANLRSLVVVEPSLERVYLDLTGSTGLREAEEADAWS